MATRKKPTADTFTVTAGISVPDPTSKTADEVRYEAGDVVTAAQLAAADIPWLLAKGAIKEA